MYALHSHSFLAEQTRARLFSLCLACLKLLTLSSPVLQRLDQNRSVLEKSSVKEGSIRGRLDRPSSQKNQLPELRKHAIRKSKSMLTDYKAEFPVYVIGPSTTFGRLIDKLAEEHSLTPQMGQSIDLHSFSRNLLTLLFSVGFSFRNEGQLGNKFRFKLYLPIYFWVWCKY
jgi:hypothetical protein